MLFIIDIQFQFYKKRTSRMSDFYLSHY